ncbi:hypothetical protein FHN55_02675 [Streptomyces sp. NP160]|uniref:NERD domain-containing protein n=1 Tax=Streptomyces sp. NP160 TaxID=2586637 RepID=UPI00111961B0|nr:NERD domain-containing protein [Streptomyces sp. NP160]TNM69671.1 hypothetical protein FHN55_02675 [Streptomyces sp. NP160]
MSVVPAQGPAPDALARALVSLAAAGWTVLHQLRWPGRLRKPLAHVVVGPGGVLVVDVQPWAGVVVDEGVLRVGRRTRARECTAAVRAAAAVASLLHAEHHDAVRAVLCLTGSATPPAPETAPVPVPLAAGVMVVAACDLHRWALELPVRLDDDEAHRIAAHLRWQLGEAAPTSHAQAPGTDPGDGTADEAADGARAVVVPLTRRALRDAERLAARQRRRGVLSRPWASRDRSPADHSQPTPSPSRSSLRL